MNPQAQAILRSARIAELRASASTVAALCRAAPIVLSRESSSSAGDRRLFLLLARERRRASKLLELLRDGE